MIIPIRCFSCGALIAHKWDEFNDKVSAGIEVGQALDEVGLDRIERFRVKKTMIVKRLSVLGTDNVDDDCYSPGLLWNS